MSETMPTEERDTYPHISKFLDRIKKRDTDIGSLLREAIKYDGPDKPLPFELVRQVLNKLDGIEARQRLLSAALDLHIWQEYEHAWLLLQQFRLQQQLGRGNWRQRAIPHAMRIWNIATPGSALRGDIAYWLAQQDVDDDNILLSALCEASPRTTYPNYYVRRLRLWGRQPERFEEVLPQAIPGLADAWGLLGEERLADHTAVAALLALALQYSSPLAAGRFREEVETLLPILSKSDDHTELYIILDILPNLSSVETTLTPPGRSGALLIELLQEDFAPETLRGAAYSLPLSKINDYMWQVICTANVAHRKRPSSFALKILEEIAGPLLSHATPENAWAFYYLKAFLHTFRIEHHAALLAVDDARRLAGRIGSCDLLYITHNLRRRITHNLGLTEVWSESEAVLGTLDRVRELCGRPPGDREAIALTRAFGIETDTGQQYSDALQRLRNLRKLWETSDEVISFGNQIALITEECNQVFPSRTEEPLLFAQMRFDLAQLALAARYEWQWNRELYQATIKPCLDDAFCIADELEAYKLLEIIQDAIGKHKHRALRQYEIPFALTSPVSARQYDLKRLSRLLRATGTASERRWLLSAAHKNFSDLLSEFDVDFLSLEETLTLLEILQDLKQPSLEDGTPLPLQQAKGAESREDEFLLDNDEVISDDFSSTIQERWREIVAQRLQKENALCLEFFYTNRYMYCFVLKSVHGQLKCGLMKWRVSQNTSLRQAVNRWRTRIRALVAEVENDADISGISSLYSFAGGLERELQRNGNILPAPLEDMLGNQHAGVVYVAPIFGLHGLPLHAIRAESDWCLSQIGPVLQISKARQLAISPQTQTNSPSIRILTGPEDNFQRVGRNLAHRIGTVVANPRTRQELHQILHNSKIIALLGHGWFDKERPMRSRIALDHGMRLTLRDVQKLGLEGVEIILLSCWTGWSVRSNLPLGELYSGPSAWMVGGAGAVLAPLWSIPIDEGSQFIADYLEARCSGETRANALQYAREESDNDAIRRICSAAYVLWGTDSL